MKDLGLVYNERRGYNLHYFLNPDQLDVYKNLSRQLLGDSFFSISSIILEQEENNPMSETLTDCAHPEKHSVDGDCTPEQIRECHGDEGE
jgi:hypothetical protein